MQANLDAGGPLHPDWRLRPRSGRGFLHIWAQQKMPKEADKKSIVVPLLRTNYIYLKNSFSYSGVTLSNNPPYNLGETKSLSQFKR